MLRGFVRLIVAMALIAQTLAAVAPVAGAAPFCIFQQQGPGHSAHACVDTDTGGGSVCVTTLATPPTCAVDGPVGTLPSLEGTPAECAEAGPDGCGRADVTAEGEPCVARGGAEKPCRPLNVNGENVTGRARIEYRLTPTGCEAFDDGERCTWASALEAYGIGKEPGAWRLEARAHLNEYRCVRDFGCTSAKTLPGTERVVSCTFEGEDALIHDEGCGDVLAGLDVSSFCSQDDYRAISATLDLHLYHTSPTTGRENDEWHQYHRSLTLTPRCEGW